MFYLDPARNKPARPRQATEDDPDALAGLQERETLHGVRTPGGDSQDQWSLQFFLNFVDFGMNLQEAIDAPSFHSLHFPSSFYPRRAEIGKLVVEGRISPATREVLSRRGHVVDVCGEWENGRVLAISREDSGVLKGAASPKGAFGDTGYAIGCR